MWVAKSGNVISEWMSNTSTTGNNEKNRAIRSKTFPGIAKAIANQWGKTLLEKYQKSNTK